MSEAFEHLETKTSLSFLESVKAIVQNKILLMRMLNIFYQWFCGAIGYQGTLYIATKLSGDPHFNFAMTMIPAIPGTFVYLLLPDRIGRRYTLILCEVILGNLQSDQKSSYTKVVKSLTYSSSQQLWLYSLLYL